MRPEVSNIFAPRKRGTFKRLKYRTILSVKLLYPERLIKRIVVQRKGAIGDVLMTTPAIRGLRHKYPQADIIVETSYPELFELNPYVNQAVRDARQKDFDLYVTMVYEDCYPLREHITDIFCRCAGVPSQGKSLDLFFASYEHRAILRRLSQFGKPFVTVHPVAGPWTRNKDWPLERWEEAIERIRTRCDVEAIQIGTPDEPFLANTIDWRGQTTLREVALTIRYAALHLSCNSGSQQLAHAVETPAVVLYGTTHPVGSGYAEQVYLYGGATATPCYHRELCEHRAAMDTIQVEEVVAVAVSMLEPRLREPRYLTLSR